MNERGEGKCSLFDYSTDKYTIFDTVMSSQNCPNLQLKLAEDEHTILTAVKQKLSGLHSEICNSPVVDAAAPLTWRLEA